MINTLQKQLLDLQEKCPQLSTHTQAILDEIEEDETLAETVYIQSTNGFVLKKDMVKLIFEDSRHRFLQTINMIRQHHPSFAVLYKPYRKSPKMPIALFKKMMKHIEMPFVLV